MTVTATAYRLEILDIADPVLQTPLRVDAGMAYPSTTPGSGLDWNPDAVKRLLIQ
jgi:mandelate racemase